MQTNVDTSAGFDWDYLHSLWPTMQAARHDWVTTSANPKAPHDRAAWKRTVAAGGPPYLGIGFGDSQAKQSGECMFGARFQLPVDATLAHIAAEFNATTQLILELAALPHASTPHAPHLPKDDRHADEPRRPQRTSPDNSATTRTAPRRPRPP